MEKGMADIPNSDSEQTAGAPTDGVKPTPGVGQSVVGDGNLLINLQNISGSNININLPMGLHLVDAAGLGFLGAREWARPTPPRPSREMIGRSAEFKLVSRLLVPGAKTAITAAVHGTPGVGKTLLAEHLAVRLAGQFPGGVLFERCGAGFRDPLLAQPILDRWGSHAFGRRPLPEGVHFTPDAVCDLLAGHGALLVILDDVWDLAAVQPLLEALPFEACLLITTRSQRLARDLSRKVFALDVLNPADALALLNARAGAAASADQPLLAELAKALGYHALALDLAGRSLDRLPRSQWAGAVQEMSHQVRQGQGFGELHLPGDEDMESRVEAALKYSYNDLDEDSRRLYRSLGVFAADASFNSQAAAGLWECPVEQAQRQLSAFSERGLLDCLVEGERWQQHSLLRAYSLALLRGEGKEEERSARHARTYLDLMRDADDRQVYFLMRPDYAQLRHAFAWAIARDLGLAQAIAANTANLQAAFGFAGDNLAWSQELVQQVRVGGEAPRLAAALVTLGNALARIAGQGGEDRAGRLRAALEAYDEALRFRTPQAAPLAYAMTQNNRGTVLRDLAGLGGEDRGERLRAALEAYDEALRFRTPEAAPLGYAATQTNRGTVLSDLAGQGGEDRAGRLQAALEAYDEALRFRTPQAAPLDYAMTQNNRGTVLSDLAGQGGEGRAGRLQAALEAYGEALRFRTPQAAPLDYAMTQGNISYLYIEMADLPGEDHRACLLCALQTAVTALGWFRQCQHEPFSRQAEGLLRRLKEEADDLFADLWAEADLGDMPKWLQ
jgi:hypothetical protein